nr:E-beta-farnesene synthase [Tanacetum cinerariifolium]
LAKKGKKTKPYVIPYSRFTKLIIYHLGRHYNIHQRFGSSVNLAEDDLSLGNLKFVPKGETDKVFRIQIPEELITDNTRKAPYYNAYLEMVTKHKRKIIPKKEGGKKKTAPKTNKPMKPTPAKQVKLAPAKQPKPKPVKEKSTKPKPTPSQKADTATEEASNGPSVQPQDDTSTNIVRESPSLADAETEDQTTELDEGQAGSDPGKTLESRPSADDDKMNEDQARPDPGKSHFSADEQVILEDPPSSSKTLSSMEILDDTYIFGDQFFNDKSIKDELGKQNVDAVVVSMDPPHKINQTVNEVVKEAVHIDFQAPIRDRFRELPEADMKEIPHQRMFKSDLDLGKKKRHDYDASGSKQPPALQSSAWKTSDTREAPSSSSKQQSAPHSEQPAKDVPIPDDVNISDLEDTDTTHLSKIKTRPDWLKPAENNWANALAKSYKDPEENKLLRKTKDMGSFIKWFCKRIGKKKLSKSDLKGPGFKGHWLVPDVSKPLSLGGPPAYGITHWLFKRKEFYITRHSAPYDRRAVGSHKWILSVISIKTFKRYGYAFLREIAICKADYNKCKISEADFKNLHPNDFDDLYLLHLQGKLNHLPRSDKVHLYNAINLWIKNIVIRQHVGDLQLDIESYQTKLNLTESRWDALKFLLKEYYTIVSKPGVVIYIDRNDQKKMTRENDVHKFSDGTLTRVLHKLDHMVKDFKLYQYNPSMENRIWYEDDKKRSKEFIEVTERRLKIQRIFWSLESFVGGFRDVDYRTLNRIE